MLGSRSGVVLGIGSHGFGRGAWGHGWCPEVRPSRAYSRFPGTAASTQDPTIWACLCSHALSSLPLLSTHHTVSVVLTHKALYMTSPILSFL